MSYIDVIEYEDATGDLKEIYDSLIDSRGKLAEIHKVQSLNPESILRHMQLYLTIMFGKSPLRRVQREMMAVVVSKANNCDYCQRHHMEAVNHYWKDWAKTEALRTDYTTVELTPIDRALCDLANTLTLTPADSKDDRHLSTLRELGLTDRAILDATLVISYFNFVNRLVSGLGVNLEADAGGYKYD